MTTLFTFDSFGISPRDNIPCVHVSIRTLSDAFLQMKQQEFERNLTEVKTCSELDNELPGFVTHALKHLSESF